MTKKQAKVLAFIRAWMQRTGRSPSYREITAHLGVTVRALKHQEILSTTRRHRGIHLSPEHLPPSDLPIIGRVAVGTPIL